MAMDNVDASGFVGASFWKAKAIAALEVPTLRAVAETAVAWLDGTHLDPASVSEEEDGAEQRKKWLAARKHTFNKVAVVEAYTAQCASQELLNGALLPEWIVPAFHHLLGLGVGGDGSAADSPTAAAAAADAATPPSASSPTWLDLVEEISPGIYAFDLFTPALCELLVTEVDAFEATDLPRRRPNTMNRLGLVVNEIGLEPLMTELLQRLIAPLCAALYPSETVTCALDAHHSFVVQYKADLKDQGDAGLDMHHDVRYTITRVPPCTHLVCLPTLESTDGVGFVRVLRRTRSSCSSERAGEASSSMLRVMLGGGMQLTYTLADTSNVDPSCKGFRSYAECLSG